MMHWENFVRKVEPYSPGEQPQFDKMIKLNTNENPYPPSPLVCSMIQNMDMDLLRRYPSPSVEPLVGKIAEYFGVKNSNVFVGVGSDDVIAMLFMTFFGSDKPIFFPDITYSFYDVWADMLNIPYEKKPLDKDFLINVDDYKGENGGIIFPNPNAPTGIFMPLDKVEEIIAVNRDIIVIVDEAYIDFGGISAISLIDKYDNLVVTQTFSKSRSLAGMRIGYCIGSEKVIKYLNDVKYSFNSYTMNQCAIMSGVASIEDDEYFKEMCDKVVKTREWVKKELKSLGFEFPDSKSNFIFATHPKIDCVDLFNWLRDERIFVRHFSKPERINNYLRITVGTDDEMRTFINKVKEYIDMR